MCGILGQQLPSMCVERSLPSRDRLTQMPPPEPAPTATNRRFGTIRPLIRRCRTMAPRRSPSTPFFPVAREAGLGKKSISKCTQRLNSLCDCRRGRDLLLANHFAHNCQLIIDVETTPLGKRKKLDGLRARRKEWDTTR
jgi:hypothetical protein